MHKPKPRRSTPCKWGQRGGGATWTNGHSPKKTPCGPWTPRRRGRMCSVQTLHCAQGVLRVRAPTEANCFFAASDGDNALESARQWALWPWGTVDLGGAFVSRRIGQFRRAARGTSKRPSLALGGTCHDWGRRLNWRDFGGHLAPTTAPSTSRTAGRSLLVARPAPPTLGQTCFVWASRSPARRATGNGGLSGGAVLFLRRR